MSSRLLLKKKELLESQNESLPTFLIGKQLSPQEQRILEMKKQNEYKNLLENDLKFQPANKVHKPNFNQPNTDLLLFK